HSHPSSTLFPYTTLFRSKLLFSNFQDLIQEIQASFDSDETPRKSEILRPLLEGDLLVLDELGSQKPSLFVQDILYYVINTRYNRSEEHTSELQSRGHLVC